MLMMLKNCLLCLGILCAFQSTTSGKIKNGYSLNIHTVIRSLETLRQLAGNRKLTVFQKLQLKEKINQHISYVFYFGRTENLLGKFREIAPELYEEIDSITDCKGRVIDVYVKLVPQREMELPVGGITNIDHVADDDDAYRSHYGDYSVSVKIRLIQPALSILAHEFGHIKYQVPNLAAYFTYYNLHYRGQSGRPELLGHDGDDNSGKSATEYVKRFKACYRNYLRTGRGDVI